MKCRICRTKIGEEEAISEVNTSGLCVECLSKVRFCNSLLRR